jgi:dGTP triphosphohydrolase
MDKLKNPLAAEVYTERVRPREEDIRGPYFRDQTAIIHSMPFRRLKHKTQVFFSPDNDHVCTRMEHTLHVATIAAAVCRAFGLDGDLAQATPPSGTGGRRCSRTCYGTKAASTMSCTPCGWWTSWPTTEPGST